MFELEGRPIGVFDSGLGGLSIAREIRRLLPDEDVLYFADTAHCPYGSRSKEQIRRLARSISSYLIERGAKAIVVACNTASVAALADLRATFALPFVGVVPAVKPAAQATRNGHVVVLATPATFQGEMFADLVRNFASGVGVHQQVCPGLVEMVERGETDTAETRGLLDLYLQPVREQMADTVVLGCTHYPFLRPLIQEIVGPDVLVLDTGEPVARQVARVLDAHRLRNPGGQPGEMRFYTSGSDSDSVARVIANLLGGPIPAVETAPIPD